MLQALHTHPRYWGQDSLVWRPSRWIVSSSDHMDTDLGARLLRERLFIPQRGTFIAWSEGARNCPGKKFAQVEHVAIMAALFRDYQATPATKRGETQEGARKRVLDIVKDSNVELLLQMRNPGSVSIKWSHKWVSAFSIEILHVSILKWSSEPLLLRVLFSTIIVYIGKAVTFERAPRLQQMNLVSRLQVPTLVFVGREVTV